MSVNFLMFYFHPFRLKTCANRLFASEVERSSMGGADKSGPTAADGLRGGVWGWPGGGGQCHGRDGENCLVLTFYAAMPGKRTDGLALDIDTVYRNIPFFCFQTYWYVPFGHRCGLRGSGVRSPLPLRLWFLCVSFWFGFFFFSSVFGPFSRKPLGISVGGMLDW